MKKKFKAFLKKRGAWILFKNEFEKRGYRGGLKRFYKDSTPGSYLSGAFVWDEGYGKKFWTLLSDEWNEIIDKNTGEK